MTVEELFRNAFTKAFAVQMKLYSLPFCTKLRNGFQPISQLNSFNSYRELEWSEMRQELNPCMISIFLNFKTRTSVLILLASIVREHLQTAALCASCRLKSDESGRERIRSERFRKANASSEQILRITKRRQTVLARRTQLAAEMIHSGNFSNESQSSAFFRHCRNCKK